MTTSNLSAMRVGALACSLALAACGGAAIDGAGETGSELKSAAVLKPGQMLFDKSYSQYATISLQQQLAQPMATHPAIDGGDCSVGNSGAVWHLHGGLGGDNSVNFSTQHCTVPSGTWLNISVVDVTCTIWEDVGSTTEELRACAKEDQDGVTILEAAIDGVPVKHLKQHRFLTDPVNFDVTLPADNIFQPGAPWEVPNPPGAGTYPQAAVGEGFFILVPPLASGAHVITTRGVIPGTEGPFGSFETNVTYNLTVQ
jgi:hypothetical protein